MFEIIKAGGWVMLPLLLCSVVATAIVLERFWSLQQRRVAPETLVAQIWQWSKAGALDAKRLQALRTDSPLGRVLAGGLAHRTRNREAMKDSIEEAGRHVVHELERYLNMLGTIATISPLLGLLGTVFGMIQIFSGVSEAGFEKAELLAAGIAQALITTAAGLVIAIPALAFYRYFRRRVEDLVVAMEQEALKLVDVIAPANDRGPVEPGAAK